MKISGWTTAAGVAAALVFGSGQAARQGQISPRTAARPDAPNVGQAARQEPLSARLGPMVSVAPAEQAARSKLDARIVSLGRAFPGRVGIAVRDLQTGWTAEWQGSRYVPQQSVSKFWVALTMLDKVDQGL